MEKPVLTDEGWSDLTSPIFIFHFGDKTHLETKINDQTNYLTEQVTEARAEVIKLREEVATLFRSLSTQEKANIDSRRSLCAKNEQLEAELRTLKETQ